MLAQGELASRCNCFKRDFFAVENPRRAILQVLHFCAPTTRIGDAAT
jgi:hypothetical protein